MKRNSRLSAGPATLRGKVCLVTGGAQGIGLALTRALARQGAHVHVTEFSFDSLESAAADLDTAGLGPQVTFHHVDVTDRGAYEQCIADVHATGERLDVLVSNATVTQWREVRERNTGDAVLRMRTGYDAMACGVNAALPLMRAAGGYIVNIAPAAGVAFAGRHSAAYAATTAAINAYTRVLSRELATSPVHVMLVRPGPVGCIRFFARHIRSHRIPRIADVLRVCSPEQIAHAVVDGLLTRRRIVDVPGYLPATYRSRAQAMAGRLAALVINKIGPARWVGAVTRAIVVPLDTALQERSAGRLSVGRGLGMTTLLLTTTRAGTGEPRRTPLFSVDHAGGYAVVGSNFGLPHHPAWTADLLKNPTATVTTTGQQIPVTARLVNGPDRAEIWTKLLNLFPGYQTYSDRSGRSLRVFHLQPTTPPATEHPREDHRI